MPYSAQTFTLGEQPTTSKWNLLWGNDASFNDGTGIANNAITAAKIEVQQAWQVPTFTNSWINYDTTVFQAAGYMKDSLGFVHLRGLVKNGTVSSAIFTLPAGYRPLKQLLFSAVINGSAGRIDIMPSGVVIPSIIASNAYVQLDGFSFIAEA